MWLDMIYGAEVVGTRFGRVKMVYGSMLSMAP